MICSRPLVCALTLLAVENLSVATLPAQELRLKLAPEMVVNEADVGEPAGLVDEQDRIIGPPVGEPESSWHINSQHWKRFPYSAHIDLGEEQNLASLWLFDTNGTGDVVISYGKPGDWTELHTYDCGKYKQWIRLPMDVTTRYVQLTRRTPGANFSEVALYAYTPEAYQAMLERKAAEAEARKKREAELAKAMEEMRKRPLIDVGEPFGKLYLVDEINCAEEASEHDFVEDPPGASEVQTILGKPCRVLRKTAGEAALFSYRIGRMKLLRPHAAYVLSVEYPEDAPRTVIVRNGGNETSRGFHTGATFGDALHPKYVNNVNESLDVPLSGQYESWNQFFNLHDRFPDGEFPRGDKERPLAPEDGFRVTIAQFSARNIPASQGAAVSRIRLFAVPDADALAAAVNLPPEDLPQRHLFWREEMADGVIGTAKNKQRGITNALDWYRHKVDTMHVLGLNTYSKDLLEFGACQHWDTTGGGGNDWAFFNSEHKDLWSQIVALMGEEGINILPYYEYSGSKGYKGLGNQRRAKPLTRNDAYTHISWIESANADITDPDTYADFEKMLNLTICQHTLKAHFVGAWLRPRSQLPMSFADATRDRFADEANDGARITRQQLIDDAQLLARYKDWWYGKRREFLIAMRDYLREGGVKDAVMLYTASASEPGVPFPTWEPRIVTDQPDYWRPILKRAEHRNDDRTIVPVSLEEVVDGDQFLEALLAEPLNWGAWEVNHSNPPSDPQRYKDTEGVLMTHCFNRGYTVASSKTFDAFRGPSGLAAVRHYSLNENMLNGPDDKPKHGYFVVDVERAGPYSMLAEAWAVANGDPTYIGYLSGGTFSRGFPQYARNFNTAFLALPALPSQRLGDASSDDEVVVRMIRTPSHGTYLAVVNTGLTAKRNVTIALPSQGTVTDAATGERLHASDGTLTLSMYPCQLQALRVQ